MLYGKMIKELSLFTFYRTVNNIDYSAHQDTLMLMDISTYHQQLKDLWQIQPASLMFTEDEIAAIQASQGVNKFSTVDFLSRAGELRKRGEELIEFYPRLIPDEFIRNPKEEAAEDAELENKTPLIREPKDV